MGGRSAGLPLILRDVGKRSPSIDLSLGGRSPYPESVLSRQSSSSGVGIGPAALRFRCLLVFELNI